MSRPPRPPRRRNYAPRARGRSYDPDALWQAHAVGSYAKPGSLGGTLNDLNPVYNPIDLAWAVLWASWRIVVRRDGIRAIRIPANGSYSVNEVRAEWRRLHIDSCILAMSNAGMTVLVGARQEKWARYVLGRMLAGEAVPAWAERQ